MGTLREPEAGKTEAQQPRPTAEPQKPWKVKQYPRRLPGVTDRVEYEAILQRGKEIKSIRGPYDETLEQVRQLTKQEK